MAIEDLAYGGSGVGRVGNFVVFVRHGVPGDRLRVRVVKRKKSHAEAEIVEILQPSASRVDPVCPHFGECGGCNWQNVSYSDQLVHKQRQAEQTVARLGKARPETIAPIIASPRIWRYRNKMEFTFGTNASGEVICGFHEPGAFDRIWQVKQCHLQPEPFDDVLAAVTAWARRNGLSAYAPHTHTGFLRHLILRHSVTTDEALAVLLTNSGELPDPESLVKALREACPGLKGFIWGLNTGVADFARQERELWRWGEPELRERLGELAFRVSPEAFFQVNTLAAEKLYGVVREMLGDDCVSFRLLDAYCGTGTIGLFCADRAADVVGVEIVREAIWDARDNAERNGVRNATFLAGDMRAVLPLAAQIPGPPVRCVIMDPPRGGMNKHALRGLLDFKAPVLIYVSCNPATLSRDLAEIVEAGYRPVLMQPVDLFPQTYHIETVVKFVRE